MEASMTHGISEDSETQPADYEFWGLMPGWTISEAAALLLGLDPDSMSREREDDVTPGTHRWRYRQLRRRLARAQEMDDLDDPMRPQDFLEWAISNKLPVSDTLLKSVKTVKKLRNWRVKYFSMKRRRDELAEKLKEDVNPKERTSLLTIILGMTRHILKHKAGNIHTVSMIERAIKKADLKLSDDVIRKFLEEAAERLE
jgi:hypothetical protein